MPSQVSEAEARGEQEAAKPSLPTNNIGASSENETLQSKKEDDLEDKEESGWGGEELELEVPESDTNDLHEPLQNSQEIPNEAYRTEKLENASPRSPVTSGQNHDRIASEVGKQSSENKEQIEIAEALNGESKNNHSMPQKLSTEENTDSTKETPAGFNRRVADESAAEKPERDSSYEISMHEDQEVQLPKDTSQKEFRDLEDDPSPVSMDDTVSAISPLQENGNSDLANESEQVNGESSLVLKASSHKEDQQELDNDYQEGSLSGNENLQEVQSEPRPNGLFRQDVTENLKDGNLQSSGEPSSVFLSEHEKKDIENAKAVWVTRYWRIVHCSYCILLPDQSHMGSNLSWNWYLTKSGFIAFPPGIDLALKNAKCFIFSRFYQRELWKTKGSLQDEFKVVHQAS